jgi:hypothetical protein
MTSVGSFAVALARLGDPTIMARMPPTKLWSSADLDAVIERVAPDVLALLGDGVPRTEAAIVAALAGRHLTAPACKLSDFLSGSAGQRDAET